MLQDSPQLVPCLSPPQIPHQATPELSLSAYETSSPHISQDLGYAFETTKSHIQTRRNSDCILDTGDSPSKYTKGIKSQFDYDLDFEYESVDDIKDLDFGYKEKKLRYSKTPIQKKKEFAMPISQAFLKGLHIYVNVNQSNDVSFKERVKTSLNEIGATIVDDLVESDVYISDNELLNRIGTRQHEKMKNRKGKRILQIRPSQIEWAFINQRPIESDKSANSSTSSVQCSSFSSATIMESTFSTTTHASNSHPNEKINSNLQKSNTALAIHDTTFAISPSQFQNTFQSSNASSPAIQLPKASETIPNLKTMTLKKPKQLSSIELMTLTNKVPTRKKMCNGSNNRYGTIASQLSILNTTSINKNSMPLPHIPKNHSLQIIISDIRHRFAPIFKYFGDIDQIPRLYLEPAPRYYCMNAFQKVPPNADQFAKNYIMRQQATCHQKTNMKLTTNETSTKEMHNDIAMAVGDNLFCYVCRKSFDNPIEHHSSLQHKRQTQLLWNEFDNLASSFNDL